MSELSFSSQALEHQRQLREHPAAPNFNFQSSDLLRATSLEDVRRYEMEGLSKSFWEPGERPEWMPEFLERVYREVPFYREYGDPPRDFESIPTVGRRELKQSPELLVPDSMGLEDLTVYTTSGTTGSSLAIPTDPGVSSKVLVLLDKLLKAQGLELARGAGRLALAAVFFQEQTLTYPSLSHYLGGASTLKLNLHPGSWNRREDPALYLEHFSPRVITGCPLSLQRLSELVPDLRPDAIFSSAVALHEGLREELSERFACPVTDVYSLTEAKFIAAKVGAEGFDLLSPDLFVEILDESGRTLPAGELGEIVVSGGRNRYLPLLRYRTGDYGRLTYRGRQPYLTDFHGRAPVALRNGAGETIASLDVIRALHKFPLVGFSFRLSPQGEYSLSYCGEAPAEQLEEALRESFGLTGSAAPQPDWPGKAHQFES